MCEELIKTSLSIVEVLSQHHALTSPHHGVVSIPSSVYDEAVNYSFIPSLVSSFLPSDLNLSHPSLIQESEDLLVTNPLLIPGNLWSDQCMFVCICAQTCLLTAGQRECLMTIDVWKWRAAGSRQEGCKWKEKTWQVVRRSRDVVCCSWQSITQEDTLITTSHLRLTFIAAGQGNTVTSKEVCISKPFSWWRVLFRTFYAYRDTLRQPLRPSSTEQLCGK